MGGAAKPGHETIRDLWAETDGKALAGVRLLGGAPDRVDRVGNGEVVNGSFVS